jgi:hypothetical protein
LVRSWISRSNIPRASSLVDDDVVAQGGGEYGKAAQVRYIGGGRRGGKEQEGWGRRSEAAAA